MDSTVEFLWSRHRGLPVCPADWAIRLLELGHESDSILRLTDRSLPRETTHQLILNAVNDLGRPELLDKHVLMLVYESESIADYLAGRIDGWTLMRRGCELFREDKADDPGRIFWLQVIEDAGEHGGQGICLQFPFVGNDFDQILREALRHSGRPVPDF